MKKNPFLDGDDFDVQLERDIERPANKFAKQHGWFHAKLRFLDKRGAMDDLYIRDGHVIFVEFKRPGKEPTKQQQERAAEMRLFGAKIHAVDTLEKALALFR